MKRLNKKGLRRINKKGIFYSLSVVLFLIFLIIVFNSRAQVQKKEEQSYIIRAQLLVMDRFVKDFDRYYIQNILEAATKPALVNMTQGPAFSRADLITLMETGDSGTGITMNQVFTTDSNFNQAISTLSFLMDEQMFDYEIVNVVQVNWYTLRIDFKASYHFKTFNNTWSRNDKELSVTVPVYGLWHPHYRGRSPINTDWIEYTTGCYANIIFSDPVSPCPGKNIKPIICGDNVLDPGEQCDGTAAPIPLDYECIDCQLVCMVC